MIPLALAAGGMALGKAGLDLLGNAQERDAMHRASNTQKRGQDEALQAYLTSIGASEQYYKPDLDAAGGDLTAYRNWLQSDEARGPSMGQFQYDKTVKDFLDPSVAYATEQSNNALDQSASNAGQLYSGATQKALQKNNIGLANQNWNQASQQMSGDRAFNYNDFMNHFKNLGDLSAQKTANLSTLVARGDAAKNVFSNNQLSRGQVTGANILNKAGITAADQQNSGQFWNKQIGIGGDAALGAIGGGINAFMGASNPAASIQQAGESMTDYGAMDTFNAGADIDAGNWDALANGIGGNVPTAASPFARASGNGFVPSGYAPTANRYGGF